MKVVVTGGTGFIGRALAPALVEAGHEVTVLARRAGAVPAGARALAADVADRAVIPLLAGAEAIVHLAGRSDASASHADPVGYTSVNALGTLNVLEAARQFGAGVIFASSQRVYEPWRGPLDEETTPLRPNTAYGYSKVIAENCVQLYARIFDVPTITYRLFSVYGPGQRAGAGLSGVVAIFAERALAGRELVVHHRHQRDFVYISDAVNAFQRAVASLHDPRVRGRVYNIGSGQGTSFDQLAQLVVARSGATAPIREMESNEPVEEVYTSIERARRDLGFEPTIGLVEGLDRYLDWLRGELAREAPGNA